VTPVPAGGNLQAALDAAQPGDTLILPAGATFTGSYILRNKPGTAWITIQSSALSQLPGPGQRVGPAQAPLMPKLLSPGSNAHCLSTDLGAHNYRIIGLEFAKANSADVLTTLVNLGSGDTDQSTLAVVPQHLVLDRCYIHGDPSGQTRRGISLNSGDTQITGCTISEIHQVGNDTQAICGWNGPGPYQILNNDLEASGENVMFGGSSALIPGLVPSDIVISRNHIIKPLAWRGQGWTVKNLIEFKSGQRVRIEGNLLENCWADAQTGTAVVLKSGTDDALAPWTVTQNVLFTNNIVRHCGNGVNILGIYNTLQTNHISIVNNLFDDINNATWGGTGYFLLCTETPAVHVEHNTVLQANWVVGGYGNPSPGLVFQNNIAAPGAAWGDGVQQGTTALGIYFPGAVFARNVIPGANPALYPANNFYPATLDPTGFVNFAAGNYQLLPTSPYHGAATDGSDIGCNFAALQAAMLM
jgi:hypothetical protein